MAYPNNHLKFPENVKEPDLVKVDGDIYSIYSFKFRGLQDFYEFLKKDPTPNYQSFNRGDLSSVTGSYDFAGVPYEDAIEKLIQDTDPGYQEYLSIQKNIIGRSGKVHQYEPIKTIAGGVIDPVAYTTGSPKIYRASRLKVRPKFLTIDTQVAYYWGTSKQQVFNRAVIITNLIHALERRGYNVDVNSFMVAHKSDEIIKAVFEVKKHGQRTNYQTLYKSLVDVEFFRRLCFRVMEVSNVKRDWPDGYGQTADEDMVRSLLRLGKEDIYFDQPSQMGIRGKDIVEDFENAMEHLKLTDKIDMEKEKEVIRNSIKVLSR